MGSVAYLCLVLGGMVCYIQAQSFHIRKEFINGNLKFSWTRVSESPIYIQATILDRNDSEWRIKDKDGHEWRLIKDNQYTVEDVWKYKSVKITILKYHNDGRNEYYSKHNVLRIDSKEGESKNLKWKETIFPNGGKYNIYHFDGDKSKVVLEVRSNGTTSIDPAKYSYLTIPYSSSNIIFEIRNIALMDAGYYGGGISETDARNGLGVILVVRGKPTKPEMTGILTVNETSDVILTCSSKSTSRPLYYRKSPSMNYIWYMNNTVIESETRTKLIFHRISKDARFNKYSCQANESVVSEKSDEMKINVLYGPSSVIVSPQLPVNNTVSVKDGDYIGPYTCSADCNPPCSIQWKYKLSNETFGNAESDGGTLLQQRVFKYQHSFRCVATSTFYKRVYTSVHLYIKYLSVPRWTVNGKKQGLADIKEGESLTLSCVVDGRPTPSVHISKYSQMGTLKSKVSNVVDISIPEVQCSDTDIYRCTGGLAGFVSKHEDVTIGVLCDPRIDANRWFKAHYGTKSGIGVKVTVNAAIISYPKPSANLISWSGPTSTNIRNEIRERERGYINYKHWIISTIPAEDDRYYGNYSMTYNGKVIFTITINEEGKPKPPLNFTAYSYTSGYVNLTWISNFNGGPEQFFILSRKEESSWVEVANITDPGEGHTGYYDPGLQTPGHKYWYQLESCNRINCSILAVKGKVAVLDCKSGYYLDVKKPDLHYRNNSDCWPCGNCRGTLPCSTTTGKCTGGCQGNYNPPYCTELIASDQSSTVSITTVIITLLSTLLVVGLGTVAIQHRMRRKQENQRNIDRNTSGAGNQPQASGAVGDELHDYVELTGIGDDHAYNKVYCPSEASYSENHTYSNI